MIRDPTSCGNIIQGPLICSNTVEGSLERLFFRDHRCMAWPLRCGNTVEGITNMMATLECTQKKTGTTITGRAQ